MRSCPATPKLPPAARVRSANSVTAAGDSEGGEQLSGMAQGVGYVIAAFGPLVIGALHDATDGWTVPMIAVLAVGAALAVPGLPAGRNRTLGSPQPIPAPEVNATN